MPTQPIRNVIIAMTITAWTCIQFSNGLSAQETSSRRTTPSQATPAVTMPTADIQKKTPAQRTLDQHQTTTSVQSVKLPMPTQRISSIHVPVPSLEDPEMFRVPAAISDLHDDSDFRANSNQFPQPSYAVIPSFSGKFPRPANPFLSPSARRGHSNTLPVAVSPRAENFMLPEQPAQLKTDQQKTDQQYAAAMQDEDSLLDRLPISNLHEGIVSDPVTQANVRQTVGDPYLASRSYGDNLRATTSLTTKTWRSPNMAHRPLYFEEANLERYGHTHPRLQPLISGAHFFSSVVLLPYNTGVTPARTCQYSMGYNRPGDCVPKVREQHPFNPRAALRQAVVVVGGIAGL